MSGLAAVGALLAALVGPAHAIRPALPSEPSEPQAVRLPLDHDLFTAGPAGAGQLRVAEWADLAGTAVAAPLQAAPDSVRVDHEVALRLTPGFAGGTLVVVTAGYGGLDSRGVAAEADITYSDGRTERVRWLVGEHAWPAWAGATGRHADALGLGRNVAGDSLTASVRRLPLEPDVAAERVVFRPRGGLTLHLLGVMLVPPGRDPDHVPDDEGPPAGYRFPLALGRPAVLARAPAAAPQAVRVAGEALVYADGRPARFWGVNLVGPAALPEPERADAVAAGLAARGFDLVRLHHIDTEATLLNPRRTEPGQPMVEPAALDRFDRLHAALRARGVYQYAEMWTQRAFVEGEGVPFPAGVPVGNKYVGALWPEWRQAQKAWFAAVWGRTNPYTGLRYADDPAVALVELGNETSLVNAWATGALERLPRPHRARADELWNAWLRRKYGSDGAIAAAWVGGGRAGLQEGEALLVASVAREPSTRARTELYPARRAADLVAFYSELEAAYLAEMRSFVRDELGFRAPLVCGTSFGVPHADRLLAACDVVDTHAYWDPQGDTTTLYDRSILEANDRWMERLAVCALGKPCTLSEVNHSGPNRHAQEAPLAWATLAARQGLDAVLWFAWSHGPIRDAPDGPAGALDLEGRLGADAQLESARAVYRSLPEAPGLFTRWWGPGGLQRDLAEAPGLWLPELVGWPSWLDRRVRVAYGDAPPTARPVSVPPPDGEGTGTARWSPGRLVVETSLASAVAGRATPTAEAPDPTRLRLRTASPVGASLVRDLDGAWLFTVVGRTDREGTRWSRGVPGLLRLGAGPARLERLFGEAWLGVAGTAERLDPAGRSLGHGGVGRAKGGLRVDLDAPSPWVRVR